MGEPITFPLSTAPGINPTESGGRLINCYVDKSADGSRGEYVWRRCPGLIDVFSVGDGPLRGALKFGSQLIVVSGDKAYVVSKSGGVYDPEELTGTVPGTGPVIMARNMRATPQIMVVHSEGLSKIESGTVSDFSDGDLPAANSVTFLDGYFVWGIGSGQAYSSGINDVTVSGNDFATAEAKPDGVVRVVSSSGLLAIMGQATTEIWNDSGNSTGFPFSRSAVMSVGLYGVNAVAGFEEGFTEELIWVASDRTVRRRTGYDAAIISEPDLDRLLAAITDPDDLEACVYVASGHPTFCLTSPTWTWEYDLKTGKWRERMSYGRTRWRARYGVNAFDEWLVLSRDDSTVYRIDPTEQTEARSPLIPELRSSQAHRFPGRAFIKQVAFDFEAGVGSDTGTVDPQVEISWSKDGGRTFSAPLLRSLGRQGQSVVVKAHPRFLTGPKGVQWKLRVPAPVEFALYGGAVDGEARAA